MTGKIFKPLLFVIALFFLMAQLTARADEGSSGKPATHASATGMVSLSIPPRADIVAPPRAFIHGAADENAGRGAYAIFCLRSNLDLPLHILSGDPATPGAGEPLSQGECAAGELSATVPLPTDAEKGHPIVVMVAPF
jgi:hypothetical protein